MDQESKIIGEGSYGCIFYPGMDCDTIDTKQKQQTKTQLQQEYISKIQKKNIVLKNEIEVGKKIQSIPNYQEKFSPIIENCQINIGKIKTKEIDNCKTIKNTNTNLELSKIKYVGHETLENYMKKISNPHKFIQILIYSHIQLLNNLKELYEHLGIIHNDIKENNIICRDIDGLPIIIDFGLSVELQYATFPQPNKLSKLYKYFFRYDASYEVWCIEIIMLNYMLNELNKEWLKSIITPEQIKTIQQTDTLITFKPNQTWIDLIIYLEDKQEDITLEKIYEQYGYNWRTKSITQEEITNIINDYIQNNNFIKTITDNNLKTVFRTNLLNYFSPFINQPWENLFSELIKTSISWDNYALSITFFKIITQLEIPEINNYNTLLISIIFSEPNKRQSPQETINEIKKIFSS